MSSNKKQNLIASILAYWLVFITFCSLQVSTTPAFAMGHSKPVSDAPQSPELPTGPFEVPAKYKLNEAMSRAFNESFDSRIQYEHQLQARYRAKAAYLNLLPHLSLSSIISVFTPSATGLLGVIGDLAPFLLPSRWFQAKEAALMSQAEKQALALMRADSAAQVEGLAYVLNRDQQILGHYRELLELAVKTRDKLQALELQHQMPDGSTDHVSAIINFMALDMAGLALIIHEDRIALAQSMGFQNPEAVLELQLDPEGVPIDQNPVLDTAPISALALERAYELAQMDQLIAVAGFQKRELYFNWMDPSGDYNAPLGFGLGQMIAVGRSRIQELHVRRQQLQSAISVKVAQAIAEFNDALSTYPVAKNGVGLSARRLDRVLAQIEPGSTLNTLDVESIFQDSLISAIRYEVISAGFRVARSRIDRSLLQGHYAALTQIPQLALQ